jgi:hypothetical protein
MWSREIAAKVSLPQRGVMWSERDKAQTIYCSQNCDIEMYMEEC